MLDELKSWFTVEKEVTKLTVPHNGGKITFAHPGSSGSNVGVQKDLENRGLTVPTLSELTSLIFGSFKENDSPYAREIIRSILNMHYKSSFIGFTGCLLLPEDGHEISNGILIQDYPSIRKKSNGDDEYFMDRDSLVDRLHNGDSKVRFVSNGFQLKNLTPSQVKNNSYVRGLVGEEGSHKLAEIASLFPDGMDLWDMFQHDPYKAKIASFGTTRLNNILAGFDCNRLDLSNYECYTGAFSYGILRED